ncbi:hypothetical protein SNE40_022382 [Patella caerulea]|uniref:Uncharacterized protein n=1 Tax=Patella caerulea TaxID=87958 RepID=A0AAN8G7Y1_PATCE
MGDFKNTLFGCFSNCTLCLVTYIAPCYTSGKNAEAVGENCILYGFLSMLGCIGIWSRAKIRGKIRESKGIEGSFGKDCILHWFCALCALIQESNEVGGTCGEAQAIARE